MRTLTLLPDAQVLHLDALTTTADTIIVVVSTTGDWACCPECCQPSRHRHSRRWRLVADLPWQGLAVRLELHFRRFYCDTPTCPRRTFTERLPTVVAPYGRRTRRLAEVVAAVVFALGGEAGARLLITLGLTASPDTLLRVIQASPAPPVPTPRVLGVDDWARRRGRSYGTLLVDLERHRPVDVLPDRRAATFAAWLKAHPGSEIICRDRGGAYADGARQGAPAAIQVADRWHLYANLGELLERLLVRHHALLRRVASTVSAPAPTPASAAETTPTTPAATAARPSWSCAARLAQERRARREARYQDIHALHRQGVSNRQITQQLGLSRTTVGKYLAASTCPVPASRHDRRRLIAPFVAFLQERWNAGEQRAHILWEEIRQQGFTGSVRRVREQLALWRSVPHRCGRPPRRPEPAVRLAAPPPVAAPPRSPRQVAAVLLRPPDALSADQQHYLAVLLAASPVIAALRTCAQEFVRVLRARDVPGLGTWLRQTETSEVGELREFALGIRRDEAAVTAALQHEWSSGQVEGQVTRLKLLKRQMYGRASFALLRRRILAA